MNRRIDDRSFAAAQDFILGVKSWWTRDLYPAMREDYERRAAKLEQPPETAAEVDALIGGTQLYRWYAWLERHLQRFKYSGRYGLQPYHDQDRADLVSRLAPGDLPAGALQVDDGFEVPKYFRVVDIHQHPGGIWSDEIAGYVYERGARSTTPLAGKRHKDLHDRLTDRVEDGGVPRRVLDMGCGFGKSTGPFVERFRESEIVGIDIAAPCLRLAARAAAEQQARNVRYVQADCADTGFDDESFDVVTSTMLLHEMPPPEIEKTFREAHRLLEPGGRMVHLDFYHLPDAFSRFIHYGHGRRNNEPYMEPWAEMDAEDVLRESGFTNIEIVPFEEADGTLAADYPYWRFPWTLIVAERA
jgi:ubiquinone/menaquinone biosynthesis C-methylase UbiE